MFNQFIYNIAGGETMIAYKSLKGTKGVTITYQGPQTTKDGSGSIGGGYKVLLGT